MFKLLSILATAFFPMLAVLAQGQFNIVPRPASIKPSAGFFELDRRTTIVAGDDSTRQLAAYLNDYMSANYGFKLEISERSNQPDKNTVRFQTSAKVKDSASDEGYELIVDKTGVRIAARSDAGKFYALQSLLQLIPAKAKKDVAKIPAVEIADSPRFRYRGLHLDVGRHFMSVDFVKKYIDLMSQYKLNNFHWHLTEDQGWRIEIKKYPRLTEIGSRRSESHEGRYSTVFRGDGLPVEGFYTQDQIRDVVAFAKARHVTVIPEIELPGHSSAALAAFPELGCKEGYEYKVQKTWGIFKEVFCPTEKTFQFLEDVLSETIALFPDSPYIHIGGDEVLKDFWKESPFVQELKERENLKDEHEVQSYFIRRIEKFINAKGKRIIGWDEILEGGLAPNAVVMSWRGERGGIEAARAKHEVIMTPSNFLYFDYGQGDPKYEPINIGNHVSVETVYNYDPVPKSLTKDEAKYVIGAQANVWSEYMKTPEKVEYMVFPRALALAEVVWTQPERKDLADFQKRLANQFARLDSQNVNYRIPEPKGLRNILVANTDKALIELSPPMPGAKLFYTLDGRDPTAAATEYKGRFKVTLSQGETKELKTVVVTASGRRSITYDASIMRRAFLDPIELKTKSEGVNFAFYKSMFNSVREVYDATPVKTGETKSIQLPQFAKDLGPGEPFAATFDGYINVPADGIFEFQIESKDGAVLLIGDEIVVDNDGKHVFQTVTGVVPLRKGFHRIRLKHFNVGGDPDLNLRWGIKGTGLRRIYGNELVH